MCWLFYQCISGVCTSDLYTKYFMRHDIKISSLFFSLIKFPGSSYSLPSVYLSPWTNNVKLLESTVSPLLKVALHWMLVLLYSTDTLLKSSAPCLNSWLNCVSTLVRLRSSSRVPFISHSILVIVVPDREAQFNTGSRPGIETLPSMELSNTRNKVST